MINFPNIHNSNVVTLSRALLALSFLLTLVFTPLYDLFPTQHLILIKQNVEYSLHLNFFLWFDNIKIPYIISIVVLLLSIFGLFPRYMSILQFWVSFSVYHSALVTEGGDQINSILSLLFIPLCLSDNRKNGWYSKKNYNQNSQKSNLFLYNSFVALLFIKIQISLLYFNAGVAKIYAPEWSNGSAVYYWFYDPTFGAPHWFDFLFGFFFKNDITVTIINWSVIFLEIIIFISFFLKQKFKYLIFPIAILFHFLIILVHGLPSFFLSMSGCLVIYLLNVEISIKENLKIIKQTFNIYSYVNK